MFSYFMRYEWKFEDCCPKTYCMWCGVSGSSVSGVVFEAMTAANPGLRKPGFDVKVDQLRPGMSSFHFGAACKPLLLQHRETKNHLP
jgi:hypothetical protein